LHRTGAGIGQIGQRHHQGFDAKLGLQVPLEAGIQLVRRAADGRAGRVGGGFKIGAPLLMRHSGLSHGVTH